MQCQEDRSCEISRESWSYVRDIDSEIYISAVTAKMKSYFSVGASGRKGLMRRSGNNHAAAAQSRSTYTAVPAMRDYWSVDTQSHVIAMAVRNEHRSSYTTKYLLKVCTASGISVM